MKTRAVVDDVHSKLNPTLVHDIVPVDSTAAVRSAIQRARAEKRSVSIAGVRHAMGGQQFGTGTINIDTRGMNRVLHLDADRGVAEWRRGSSGRSSSSGSARCNPDLRPDGASFRNKRGRIGCVWAEP